MRIVTLELPPDLMKTEIVLSVSTDSDKSLLFKAIVASVKSQGWNLTRHGQKIVCGTHSE